MKPEFEKVYHQLEKKHFWFKARRNYIIQELRNHDRDSRILDIGCSSGLMLGELTRNGFRLNNLYGIDISENAIRNSRNSGFNNTFVMDAQCIDLNQKFNVIIASDCLEHLQDDESALRNWHNLLKPGGIIYIFVPAFMFLWSKYDDANMHYRRYKKNELSQKLVKSGFEIHKSGFWNFVLFTPILIVRLFNRHRTSNNSSTGNLNKLPLFNKLLFALLSFENKLLKYMNFPLGISSYCIAKKKSSN